MFLKTSVTLSCHDTRHEIETFFLMISQQVSASTNHFFISLTQKPLNSLETFVESLKTISPSASSVKKENYAQEEQKKWFALSKKASIKRERERLNTQRWRKKFPPVYIFS